MRTKTILFFFLLLVVGVAKGFAQSVTRDSLLQEIQEARNLLENWDATPGSENDKVLAFITGVPVQIGDSIRNKDERCLGFLIVKTSYYRRYIEYDKTNKVFKDRVEFSEKKNSIPANFIVTLLHILLIITLFSLTNRLHRNKVDVAWLYWSIFIGGLIYFSYSLGSLLMISSLIYIFKDKIKESIKNLLQKRKEKRKQKKELKKEQKKE